MERVDLPLSEYSYEQKLDLFETLWNDLAGDDSALRSPGWHEEILRDRTKALSTGKITVSDWKDAKKRIRRNVACG